MQQGEALAAVDWNPGFLRKLSLSAGARAPVARSGRLARSETGNLFDGGSVIAIFEL